jgi:hypothetical protein
VAGPVEPPVTAASPGSVTPSMWETGAAPKAEPMANDIGPPQASDLGDAGSAVQIGASPAEPPALLIASTSVARAIRRPAPNDPLAAVRALSEEELIALFS